MKIEIIIKDDKIEEVKDILWERIGMLRSMSMQEKAEPTDKEKLENITQVIKNYIDSLINQHRVIIAENTARAAISKETIYE